MSTFDQFFDRAVKHEGKVCEDEPGDSGGPTKWGVTIGRLATIKRMKEPKRGTAAFESLKAELFALSESQISDIYRKDYWNAVRADDLPPGLNYAVADFGLNSGPARAVSALQKICGNARTGRLDAETIAEAKSGDTVDLIIRYCDERARFLNAIVAEKPKQGKFLKGWLSRVGDVRRTAIKDFEKSPAVAAEPPPMRMPKAEPPPVPSTVQTASRSWSIKLLVAGIAATLEKVFSFFTGFLPDAASEVDAVAGPLTSLGGMLKLNMSGILAAATIGIMVVVVFRHLRDKRELETLKGD
jgi:lysozyme family protein